MNFSLVSFLVLLHFEFRVEACIPMTPPDGAFITSTEDPDDLGMCDECDISEIAPLTLPEGVIFENSGDEYDTDCKLTGTFCFKLDEKPCEEVSMLAETSSGTHSITNITAPVGVLTWLTCDKDGTYSWSNVKGITRLSCVFNNCVP